MNVTKPRSRTASKTLQILVLGILVVILALPILIWLAAYMAICAAFSLLLGEVCAYISYLFHDGPYRSSVKRIWMQLGNYKVDESMFWAKWLPDFMGACWALILFAWIYYGCRLVPLIYKTIFESL